MLLQNSTFDSQFTFVWCWSSHLTTSKSSSFASRFPTVSLRPESASISSLFLVRMTWVSSSFLSLYRSSSSTSLSCDSTEVSLTVSLLFVSCRLLQVWFMDWSSVFRSTESCFSLSNFFSRTDNWCRRINRSSALLSVYEWKKTALIYYTTIQYHCVCVHYCIYAAKRD